jgi:excisionase family DNA binding protein
MSLADETGAAAIAGIAERLLTPAEVGLLFRVDARTVVRWAASGLMDSVQTPGGRWRFPESAVRRQLRCPAPRSPVTSAGKAHP